MFTRRMLTIALPFALLGATLWGPSAQASDCGPGATLPFVAGGTILFVASHITGIGAGVADHSPAWAGAAIGTAAFGFAMGGFEAYLNSTGCGVGPGGVAVLMGMSTITLAMGIWNALKPQKRDKNELWVGQWANSDGAGLTLSGRF